MNHDTLDLDNLDIAYNQKTTFGDYTIDILQDVDSENPREWENLATMVCFHKRYTLGDLHDYNDAENFYHVLSDLYPETATQDLTEDQLLRCVSQVYKTHVILPLFLYDHSGITISTGEFSCPWDSGQVGFIYMSYEDIRKEYGVKRVSQKMVERVEEYLNGEVTDYDHYISGEVYYYDITKNDESIESCSGFLGYDNYDMLSEIKSVIQYDITNSTQQSEMNV